MPRERLTEADLTGHDLSAEERAARAGDITALYHLGANPYLIRWPCGWRFRL
jgi:hypothetical protein